jgi:type II secretory pathway component PulF
MTLAGLKRNRPAKRVTEGGDVGLFSPVFSTRTMAGLCRRLEALTHGGITPIRALELMAEGDSRRPLGRVLLQVANDVRRGTTLGKAFRAHPRRFTEFFIETVANGEQAGGLCEVFGDLAAFYEKNLEIQRAFLRQLLYPACILFYILYIHPLFVITLRGLVGGPSLGSALPGYLIHSIGRGLLLPLGVLAVLGHLGLSKRLWRSLGTYAWPISMFARRFDVAHFMRSLAILMDCGFHVLTAIERSANVLGDRRMRRDMLKAVPAVERGQTLGEALGASRWLSPMAREMLVTGEQSGQLGDMLTRTSECILEDTYHKLKTVIFTLEVIAIVLLAPFALGGGM